MAIPYSILVDAAGYSAGTPVDDDHPFPIKIQTGGTGSGGTQIVVGPAAAGSPVAGAPVLVGLSDGTNARALLGTPAGRALVAALSSTTLGDGSTSTGYVADSDLVRIGSVGMFGFSAASGTGSNWDRFRLNTEATLLASGARTTTTPSPDQTNFNGARLALVVDVTVAGTGSVTPALQVKDSVSGNYKTVWTATTALTANGTYVYYFTPGGPSAQPASSTYTEVIPYGLPSRTWRINFVHNNANSITYSASAVTSL